jgi:Reverse transcriptase (RNA-dependent DNA polymerase)
MIKFQKMLDKYLAHDVFEKFKARLVAGWHQQGKGLYENLSSPTVATSSVLGIAAIAATERREVIAIDIGGAFLNADMAPTGVKVHMRLNRVMTSMLIKLDPSYQQYCEPDNTVMVKLDRALYGCVESSLLWYNDLKSKLGDNSFVKNPYDRCVFIKIGRSGNQISIVLHVDDLMVTSQSQDDLDTFGLYLKSVYPETRTTSASRLDYIGMTFYFSTAGEVRVTMDKCVDDILSRCGVTTTKMTPGASVLVEVRDAPKATAAEVKWFHTYVAKMLYLTKRIPFSFKNNSLERLASRGVLFDQSKLELSEFIAGSVLPNTQKSYTKEGREWCQHLKDEASINDPNLGGVSVSRMY